MPLPPERPPAETPRAMARAAAKQGTLPFDTPEPVYRPVTRGDCARVVRPCPFVGCRYNLTLDMSPRGGLRWRMADGFDNHLDGRDNCALDVAARRPHTLQEVGALCGVGRERVRQEAEAALEKLQRALDGHYTHRADGEASYAPSPEDAPMRRLGLDPDSQADRLKFRLSRAHER